MALFEVTTIIVLKLAPFQEYYLLPVTNSLLVFENDKKNATSK